jgi:WD40 repeat protein
MKKSVMYRYNGFISYSHSADGKLAPTIQRSLHSLAKPWYRPRALHIFRDETSLSANPALWPSIEKALSKSQWFIYLASPLAAESPWVKREIDWWLTNRDPSSMLMVLTEGALSWDKQKNDFAWRNTDAVPNTLTDKFPNEPLWVDLSWAKSVKNLNLRHSKFRSSILRLAAPMHNRAPDELDGEDVRQHRRTRRIAFTAITSLIMLTVTAVVTSYFAVKNSRESKSRELSAYSLQQLETDPELSLRLALHAIERAETVQAEDALRSALLESKVRFTIPTPGQVSEAQFSPQGDTIAVASGYAVGLITKDDVKVLELPALAWDIKFTSDGNYIVTSSWDGKARVWEVSSGEKLLEIKTPGDKIDIIEINNDGSLLLTVSRSKNDHSGNHMAHIWSMKSGDLIATLKGHTAAIASAHFDPNGSRIATGSWDDTVRLWQAKDGALLMTLEGHMDVVKAVAFSEDGRQIISGSLDLTVRCWDGLTGELRYVAGQPIGRAKISDMFQRLVRLSPKADKAIIFNAGKAVVYNAQNGQKLKELIDMPNSIPDAVFSGDGQMVAVPSDSGTTFVWDSKTGYRISEFRGHKGDLNGAAFSPDGRSLITFGTDNTARIWRIEKSAREFIFKEDKKVVIDAIWSPDGRFLTTGYEDGSVKVWNAHIGELLSVLSSNGRLSAMSFSDDSKQLLVAKYDAGGAQIWDVAKGAQIQRLVGRGTKYEVLEDADWGPDESIIIAGIAGDIFRWDAKSGEQLKVISPGKQESNLDGLCGYSKKAGIACLKSKNQELVQIWDIVTSKMVSKLNGHVTPVNSSAMSMDGQLLALSDKYRVEIWEPQSGKLKCRLQEDQAYINALSFSPSAKMIVTGGGEPDPVARVWDTTSGKLITVLRGHKHSIQSARFSPDERLVVTSSQDNTARVWSVKDGRTIATLRGHENMIFEARFSPDGRRVLTAGADATARVYDISLAKPLSELIRIARQRSPRKLTPAEAENYIH